MTFQSGKESKKDLEQVSRRELNSWRRGFTPQAEIWNGRMAIVGLILFLATLLLSNSIYSQ